MNPVSHSNLGLDSFLLEKIYALPAFLIRFGPYQSQKPVTVKINRDTPITVV